VPDKPPACEGICGLYCEFGNVTDENGCPICRCNLSEVAGRTGSDENPRSQTGW
jgi:hypothetical protein